MDYTDQQLDAMLGDVPDSMRAELRAKLKGRIQNNPYTQATEKQSQQSHVNQVGPTGSSTWTQGPDGQWTQTQAFSGPLQGAFDAYTKQFGSPLDFSSLPALDYGADARKGAEDAAYSQATSRLDPQFAQQEEHMRAQLASQGLDPGSEAFNNDYGNFSRAKNDAYGSARNYAVGQGLQAQQQAFGQSAMARQQKLSEMLRQHGQPLADLQGLFGMQGRGQGVGSAYGPDYTGAMASGAGVYGGMRDRDNAFWADIGNGAGNIMGKVPYFF